MRRSAASSPIVSSRCPSRSAGDDRIITVLEPRANFYGTEMGGIVTPSVMSRPGGDLYLTLRSLDDETVQLGLDTSPMIWLL